jgi:2-polyprenyl-3-methyl-5-hydroxy-6-metoxy-1,4-benzoquinol methylase
MRNVLKFQDEEVVKKIKKEFIHSDRELIYKTRKYYVDCLYCHASPGTLETSIVELYDLLNKVSDNKLLNVGGGAGQLSDIFTALGLDVYNIDLEPQTVDEKSYQLDLNKSADLPFQNEFFDLVICQEVIEHIENPWKLFRQIKSVLKKEGYFILTTPNIQSEYSKRLFIKTSYFQWYTPDCLSYHINPLPVWEIELIAEKNRFELLSVKGNGDYYKKSINEEETIKNCECLIFTFKNY